MADRRDYVALEWVKGEIDETLKQARYALEAFVDTPDDTTRLDFSLSYIHQVQGTLQMVEFFGAALLAEEMEQLNQAMVDGKVPASSENLAVLMQAIIQLPSYLDQVGRGQTDLPIVVLPILNDLRAARGEALLSETSLFKPDMSGARRLSGEPDTVTFSKSQTAQLLRKLRQMYQLALLGWIKGEQDGNSIEFLAKSVGRVAKLTERTHIGTLWAALDAFITAVKAGLVERSPATVQVMRNIDHAFKALLAQPEQAVQQFPEESQLKNVLFYLAKLGDTRIDRIDRIQRQYKLMDALPSEQEVQDQRARLAGPDREAVGSVVTALLEELARLKDALDLMVRTQVKDSSRLTELSAPLQQLCDTMAVVGLGNPRRVLSEQIEIIKQAQEIPEIEDDGLLMDIAGAVLYVEATLSGIVDEADLDSPADSVDRTQVDVSRAHEAVLREARSGIEEVKDSVVEYIGSHFDSSLLSDAPATLSAIRGGLVMVPLNDASRILKAVEEYVQNKLINEGYRPQWQEMDALADALVGVEYYLERLTRDGAAINHDILERAAGSLESIGMQVILTDAANANRDDSSVATAEQKEEISADTAEDDTVEVPSQVEEEPVVEDEPVAETVVDDLSETDVASDDTDVLSEEPETDTDHYEIDWSDEPETGDDSETIIDFSDDLNGDSDDQPWGELPVADLESSEFDETIEIDQSAFDAFSVEEPKETAEESLENDVIEASEPAAVEETVAESADAVDDDDDLIDDDILEIFIEEAGEVLETIDEFFPKYKANPEDQESLTEFRRAYHTLKGSGRMVGASIVGETAWSVENMLNRLIDGSIELSDDLLRVVEEVTAEIPALVKAFEDKVKPDTTRADYLAGQADALSRGEAIQWDGNQPASGSTDSDEADSAAETDADFSEQDNDENLLKIFNSELATHLEFVETFLADGPSGQKLPDALQRALHTIKGSAHMASMDSIAEIVMPMENLVKGYQERGHVANEPFIKSLTTMVELVKYYTGDTVETGLSEQAESFIDVVNSQLNQLANSQMDSSGDDVSLMSIFLSESMDIVMDAESILDQWRSTGEAGSASATLIRELDTLAQAAHAVNLMPLSQLSNELKSLYIAAEANSYIIEEKFFSLAHDGHESLISMMDRLAAGQSIRTDALFSERLKQLYELYAIPYQVVEQKEQEPSSEPEESSRAQATAEEPEQTTESTPDVQAERFSVDGDPELVEIFLEEANDILENIQQSLENWVADTQNTIEVEALQRDLHTLKGGARMAEVAPLGDLAHELEFLYEGLAQGQYQSSDALMTLLQQCHDRLAQMIGDIESSMSCLSAPDLVWAISNFRKNPGQPPAPVNLKPASPEPVEQASVSDEASNETESLQEMDNQSEDASGNDAAPAILASLPDDLDFDILEIFIDEAGELLNELENAVEEWRSDPSNEAHADEMKRVLHTLKGGARLARLKDLGDKSHDFETFVIKAQQDRIELNEAFFAQILSRQDGLVSDIEELQKLLEQHGSDSGGFGPSVIQMVSEMDEAELEKIAENPENAPKLELVPEQDKKTDHSGPEESANVVPFKSRTEDSNSANRPEAQGGAQVKRAQPQETVKVSANLLEGLVNLAGETSISRSRLEQEVSDFGFTLGDMDQTIDRLRDHVRRLDMETEAQIMTRQERAEETNYEDFDPLEMDRYSQIQQLSRSLMEATYDLQDIKSTLSDKTRDAETILLQQSRINTELQEGLMRTRMVPFNRLLPRLRRIVRQVSGELGKQVDFMVGNAEGEVDRTVLERMISPLEHLLRNAVDHGIEFPEGRSQAGKSERGEIRLDLAREGGDIVLRLEDDGKGIDVSRIRDKAIERGLMQADSDLNDTEIMQFILEAGFSTAESVTQISGRGVGMDVVNSEVKQLGGSIFIDSIQGRGTVFTIRLPFTVSVNRALMVNILDDLYALPLTSIEGIVRVTPKQLMDYYKPDAPLFEYGGKRYRLEYMGALLHTGATPSMAGVEQSVPLVLVRGNDERHSMALHVDRLMGSREIVVKTLGSQFSKVPGVSGATILGDGSVVVILDLSALIRSELVIEHQPGTALTQMEPEAETSRKKEGPAKVMVCDDSVTVRKVTSRLLERNGMEVMLAKHGGDAIAQMIDEIPDLILLDIEMPHMDGFEVASRVRHDDRLKHIPIVMITSRTGSKHRERALSIGVNDYMGKPFQEGPLLETIERLLDE